MTTNGDYQIIRVYRDGSGYEKVGPPIDRLLGDIWERFAGANGSIPQGRSRKNHNQVRMRS